MDMNPSSASDDVTVFVDTNLGTYLAVTVSSDATISDLKRRLEKEHQSNDEEIKIRSLKVNRRGCLYRLSDSMCVKGASGGDKECFLFADASVIEKIGEIQHGLQNVGSNVQFISSGICDIPLVSWADCSLGVVRKRLFSGDDSVLLDCNKQNIVDQNVSIDSDLEMGVKHSDDDHPKASVDETNSRSEPETQEDRGLYSEGFRIPAPKEHKEDASRKEISEPKNSKEKASPPAKKSRQAKRKIAEHMKENEAPVHGINEESLIDIVPSEDSLVFEGGDVPCDTLVVKSNTTEEPRRAVAFNLDNRPDSGIHRTNDTYKETDASGKHIEIRKDTSMNCGTAVEDVPLSQTQTASKRKRKFENITDLEDSLKENDVLIADYNEEPSQLDASRSLTASKKKRKFEKVTDHLDSINENNVLICDTDKEASLPEIASELSAGKTASTTLEGPIAETSDMWTDSSRRKKSKKKKNALNPVDQAVDAAPSGNGDMEERSMVASAGINKNKSSGEDVAPISRQGLRDDSYNPNPSLDYNDATEEKPDNHPPLLFKSPGENGTSSAERVQEERKPSQINDSEVMLFESQDKTGGDDAKLGVTSALLSKYEPITPSTKKKKKKKTKGSTGAEQITDSQYEAVHGEHDSEAKNKESNISQKNGKDALEKDTDSGHLVMEADSTKKKKKKKTKGSTGAEHIIDSQCDITLAEPHEAVHGEQDTEANNKESNLSQKNGKDALEKDTDSGHLVMEADSTKQKKKRKTKGSTGAEHIIDSQCDITLAEHHEAVHGEQDTEAKNKESNLSQKNGKDVSEKDTESGHLVMEADKCDGSEVETPQQVGITPENTESMKKKSKKKHDAMAQDHQKFKAEEKSASHGDPAPTTTKHDGNGVKTSQQFGKTPENAESTRNKSKRKHDAMTQDPQKLEAEKKIASHGDPALSTDSRTEALTSKRKKNKLAKTTPVDRSYAKCLRSGTEYGVKIGSNSISESTKLLSQQEHISAGATLQPNFSGNHEEVSCDGEEINFHKYMAPSQSKNEVVASGELRAEEVTNSEKEDSKLKPKKNGQAVDSSGCSHNLRSPLKSHDNAGIGGKTEASKSSSLQPQGAISNVDDGLVSQPEKTVSNSGTKTQSSDLPGKINSIPKVAGNQRLANGSGANSLTEKQNEAGVSSSKLEKSNNKDQNKPVKKHQPGVTQNVEKKNGAAVSSSKMETSNGKDQTKAVKKHQAGVTQNVVASRKASGNNNGEVLNSTKQSKSLATPVAPKYRNGSSARKDEVVVSGASTTSSEYSLSESDYSDGESNAGSCASSGKITTRRSGYSSIKGKPAKRLKNSEIFLKSSVYRKALDSSKSQPEEDSQAPEFVPDSQPV